ncbi:TrmB family transcriptional regulator [Candidatus Woesearchaeota archaeon]|nr:TrmB family transcriptional regulator [Candidatus Woesearchaeota archaeon]
MLGLNERLIKVGLTNNESKVYLELLKKDQIKASDLAKKAGLDRTITYQILDKLIGKGLVNYINKQRKKYFSASDPSHLLNSIKEQEAFVKSLISDLKKIEKSNESKTYIEIYEGKEGLKILFEEAIKSNEYSILGATGISYETFETWEMNRIRKEVAKKKLKVRAISSIKKKDAAWTKLKGIQVRFIEGVENHKATFDILGDEKICIHVLVEEKPLFIIIKNKEITETLKTYFEVLWKIAK